MNNDEIVRLTGSETSYDYREIIRLCSDDEIASYVNRTKRILVNIGREFDDEKNSEWFIRSYLALKFVLGATVLATSAEYAEDRNLQVTLPYLSYYTILNCSRAFILTLPCVSWKGEKTIEMTHGNIINTAADKLGLLGLRHREMLEPRFRAAKDNRELFSYRFPSTGLSVFGDDFVSVEEAIGVARLLTELAQINLACLEARVLKYHPQRIFSLIESDHVWHAMRYDMRTRSLVDDEDYKRVGYFARKYKNPTSLIGLATDGLIESFFDGWCASDESQRPDQYDPDQRWNLLLDIW